MESYSSNLLLLHLPLRTLRLLQRIHERAMLVRLTHRMKGGHDMLQPRRLLLGSLATLLSLACCLTSLCHFLFSREILSEPPIVVGLFGVVSSVLLFVVFVCHRLLVVRLCHLMYFE